MEEVFDVRKKGRVMKRCGRGVGAERGSQK